ncbi:MAG: 4-(cytidine 5'-diphospho)-2-C-methyl-D-erythritol kinase [Pyrinomonadaceae bacterium]
MTNRFSLPSYAKINWTLRVLGRREDGFHEIFTVFQSVSLQDTLSFARSDEVTLTCDQAAIPVDGRNLISKAATVLSARFNINSGARIHLQKHIPSPGGLGGGSSNAAIALIGLSRLWDLDLSTDELSDIAAGIGSDVPFFISGGTAIGSGRGEIIEPVDDTAELFLLIVTPEIAVPTRDAFQNLNRPILTTEEQESILRDCREQALDLDLRQVALKNDFEKSVFVSHPEIGRAKETLLGLGARNAALSGTGASVFGIFDNIKTRQAAIKALDSESTWRKFAVATVSRAEYREALCI